MPQNVNDFNHNDLLLNIDPDINDNRQSSCQYFDSTLFNNKFGSMNNMSIFHCNIKFGQSWHFKLMILNLWLLSLIKISFLARTTLLYVFSTDLLIRL